MTYDQPPFVKEALTALAKRLVKGTLSGPSLKRLEDYASKGRTALGNAHEYSDATNIDFNTSLNALNARKVSPGLGYLPHKEIVRLVRSAGGEDALSMSPRLTRADQYVKRQIRKKYNGRDNQAEGRLFNADYDGQANKTHSAVNRRLREQFLKDNADWFRSHPESTPKERLLALGSPALQQYITGSAGSIILNGQSGARISPVSASARRAINFANALSARDLPSRKSVVTSGLTGSTPEASWLGMPVKPFETAQLKGTGKMIYSDDLPFRPTTETYKGFGFIPGAVSLNMATGRFANTKKLLGSPAPIWSTPYAPVASGYAIKGLKDNPNKAIIARIRNKDLTSALGYTTTDEIAPGMYAKNHRLPVITGHAASTNIEEANRQMAKRGNKDALDPMRRHFARQRGKIFDDRWRLLNFQSQFNDLYEQVSNTLDGVKPVALYRPTGVTQGYSKKVPYKKEVSRVFRARYPNAQLEELKIVPDNSAESEYIKRAKRVGMNAVIPDDLKTDYIQL